MQLHGESIIELTDVNTGKKETYKNKNMVTNALAKLIPEFSLGEYLNSTKQMFTPLVERGMGGIYLFDAPLTENVNNIWLPNVTDAKLTGYAGHATSDGLDNKRGDYNFAESGPLSNGYKMVWDFGTDDSNGEIAALALTNHIAGFHGYFYNLRLALAGNEGYTGSSANNYKGIGVLSDGKMVLYNNSYSPSDRRRANNIIAPVDYDKDTKILTSIRYVDGKLIIDYFNFDTNHFTLSNIPYSLQLINTVEIPYSDLNDPNFYGDSVLWVSGDDGYFYGIYRYSANGPQYSNVYSDIQICKLNKATLEYTPSVTVRIPMAAIRIIEPYRASSYPWQSPVIRNGYMYMLVCTESNSNVSPTYQKIAVAKAPLSDLTAISVIPNTEYTVTSSYFDNGTTYSLLYKDKNNNIVFNAGIIGTDDTVVPQLQTYGLYPSSGSYYNTPLVINFDTMYYANASSNYTEFFPNLQYLATINNLENSVIKTSAKTMKIIYTLTYQN